MITTIISYIFIYIVLGYGSILLIQKYPIEFQDWIVKALTHLKETSARIKYTKIWDDDMEEECQNEMAEYEERLRSRNWVQKGNDKVQRNQIIAYFIGWPILLFIVALSGFLRFFNIYQRKK